MNKVQTTRPMSIKDHINLDKMNKDQTTRHMLILDHISMSTHSIKSTQSIPEPKSSILDYIYFHEENKFNTCEKPIDEVCIFDDFPRFWDKVIKYHLAKIIPCREQVESYCEDKHVDDDESLCLDELFWDDLDTHTPLEEKVELCCEDTCEDDEPLFLDILFKDECDLLAQEVTLSTCLEFWW